MAGIKETATWENHIYQIEESDPVHGGEEGVTNKPIKHLANRTLYLRKLLTEAGQRIQPKKITGASKNSVDLTGHTHEIESASTSAKGLVQLTNDTGLDSEVLALTAKAGKAIAQSVAQLQLSTTNALNQKVNKTDISDSVTSTSQTTVASSRAVKTAYDKGVEAKTLAESKQSPATTLAGYGVSDFLIRQEERGSNVRELMKDGIYALPSGGNNLPSAGAYKVVNLAGSNDYWRHQLVLKAYSTEMYVSSQSSTRSSSWLDWAKILTDKQLSSAVNNAARDVPASVAGVKAANDNANARVAKSGDIMTGDLQVKSGDYSSLRTYNASGYSVRWECAPQSANEIAALVCVTPREEVQFKVRFPKKNGTVAYTSDITKSAVGLDLVENYEASNSGGSNNYVLRNNSGDIAARLLRATYNDQSTISGAIAFRVNNSTDNYTRYCNSPAAVRTWLGLHASATRAADWADITNKPAQATRWPNSVEQGFTQSLFDNGWVRLPNGLVIQWFAFDFGDAGNNEAKTISFPLAFKKTLNVFLSSAAGDTGRSGSDGVEITSVNNTSVVITSHCQSRYGYALMRCLAVGLL